MVAMTFLKLNSQKGITASEFCRFWEQREKALSQAPMDTALPFQPDDLHLSVRFCGYDKSPLSCVA
jgi:hypothetical protein